MTIPTMSDMGSVPNRFSGPLVLVDAFNPTAEAAMAKGIELARVFPWKTIRVRLPTGLVFVKWKSGGARAATPSDS